MILRTFCNDMQVFHPLVRTFEECIIVFEEALLLEYFNTFIMQTILIIVQGVQYKYVDNVNSTCYYNFSAKLIKI